MSWKKERPLVFVSVATVGLLLAYLGLAVVAGESASPAHIIEAPQPAPAPVLLSPVRVTVRSEQGMAVATITQAGEVESVSFMGDNGLERGDFAWGFRYSWEQAKGAARFAVTLENYVQHYRPLECLAGRELLAAEWERPEVQHAYGLVQRARAEEEWWRMHAVFLDERDMHWNIDVEINPSDEANAARFTRAEAESAIVYEGQRLASILGVSPEFERWQALMRAPGYKDPCGGH